MKAIRIGIPALSFALLWLILSGLLDPFHLSLGLISVSIVMWASWKLSVMPKVPVGTDLPTVVTRVVRWRYAIFYPFVLLLNIIRANLQVAAIVLAPKMPIDPVLLRFSTSYKTDAAKILLGNSITLTPGTVTLDIDGSDFIVHALSLELATSLLDGTDIDRIARIFGDTPQGKPNCLITDSLEKVRA